MKGRLLDLGCGSGNFLEFMNRYGWETMGIDFDEKAVETAKAKNLNVKLGKLEEQNLPNNYFDAITLSHVIEHVYDPSELLRECKRILKNNGQIVIVTPNNKSIGHWYFRKNWRGLEPPRHINVFSPEALTNVIRKLDFQKIDFFTSSRAAGYFYNCGIQIKKNSLTEQISILTKIKAKLFTYFEWFLIKLKFECGEELIVIAKK